MNSLAPVWSEVEKLLSEGFSITPVEGKVAISTWKKWQESIISKEELWSLMDSRSCTAVATICGKISGNYEIIDLDVKWKPGADAILFSAIQSLYPDLYAKMRIHKTPSGGFHIPYRVSGGEVPGNQKLAGRPSTESELITHPKAKTKWFIETRGEGGYAVAPPSNGYSVYKDEPVPVLTWNERNSLIQLCKNYTEIIELPKTPKPTKFESNYYSENPFEHFNRTCDPIKLWEEFGWTYEKAHGDFFWFTKPGGRKKDVHGTFNNRVRLFYVWTDNSDLDYHTWYNPSMLLAKMAFDGDYKKTYRHLVDAGFGKIRETIEKGIVKKAAIRGNSLPANASPEAVQELLETVARQDEMHPYGIFWSYNQDNNIVIDRENLYRVAEGLGYFTHENKIIQLVGQVLYKRTERYFYDDLKNYIKEEDATVYHDTCNAYESFIQKNGTFTQTRLPLLDESMVLKDGSNQCYKFFENGYQFITAEDIIFNDYHNLSGYIWAEDIKPRQYTYFQGGDYIEFLDLAINLRSRGDYILPIIGYLAHQYKDETTGYIVILTESCADPKDGGGSGKNIFGSLLGLTTSFKNVPGSQTQFNEKFLQAWNWERVFSISDLPPKFDFAFLKEISTGNGILKKLWEDELSIPMERMPKILLSTNYSYDISDGGLKRRMIPIEFTDFFTQAGGVDVYFKGKHFPRTWSEADYNGYDTFIAEAVQKWLSVNRKLSAIELSEGGWAKRFEGEFGQVITGFIKTHYDYLLQIDWISNEDFKVLLDKYLNENNTPRNYWPSMIKMHRALKDYFEHQGGGVIVDFQKKNELNNNIKGKKFFKETPF